MNLYFKIFKNQIINKKDNFLLISIFLLIVYPLLSIPLIIYGIYKNYRLSYSLLAIILGFFGILYAPITDYYRHLIDYYEYKTTTWTTISNESIGDNFLPIISYIFSKYNLSFELIRFLITYTYYELLFQLFYKSIASNPLYNSNNLRFEFFFILFLLSGLFNVIIGLRWNLGVVLFLYATFLLFQENKKKGYILLIFSIFVHFAIIPFVLILLILKFKDIKIKKGFALILFFTLILISQLAVLFIFSLIGDGNLASHLDHYINGGWGSDVYKINLNTNALINSYINKFCSLPLILYILIKKWEKSKLLNLIICGYFVGGLTISFPIIQARYLGITFYLLLFYFIIHFNKTNFNKFILKFLLFTSCLSFCTELYVQRKYIMYGREEKFLYCPSFIIINNNYELNWLEKHFNSEGFPK